LESSFGQKQNASHILQLAKQFSFYEITANNKLQVLGRTNMNPFIQNCMPTEKKSPVSMISIKQDYKEQFTQSHACKAITSMINRKIIERLHAAMN